MNIKEVIRKFKKRRLPTLYKTLTLIRVAENMDGTFGVLVDHTELGDIPFAVTLERKWVENRKQVSCIPIGNYECLSVNSPTFGKTFAVSVPGRTHILFHRGNTQDDSRGCILIGERFDKLNKKNAILNSKHGFKEFMERLVKYEKFRLIVKEVK